MKSSKLIIILFLIIVGISIPVVMIFSFQETDIVETSIKNKIGGEQTVFTFQKDEGLRKQTGDGILTFDKTDYLMGEQSMKITTDGQMGYEKILKTNINPPLDFRDKHLKAWIKVSNPNYVDKIWIRVTHNDFVDYKTYWIHQWVSTPSSKYFQKDTWSSITISLTQTENNGAVDLSKINSIEIYVRDNGRGPVTVWFNSLSLVENNSEGILTFTFDDAEVTQYTNAIPILAKYNFSATTYVPTNFIGYMDGKLNLDQLKEMEYVYGWDVSSHTLAHFDLARIGFDSRIENEIVKSKQYLIDNGFSKGVEHFAYPFGTFDNDYTMELVKKHYKSARAVRGNIETLPPADDYRLRVMYVFNNTNPDHVLNRIDQAIENRDWVILVNHGIVDSNADHVHSTYLKSKFEKIVEGVYNSGIKVMTVSEVYEQIIEKKDMT